MDTRRIKLIPFIFAFTLISCGGPDIEEPEWLEDVPKEHRAESYYFPDLEMYYMVNTGVYVYRTNSGWRYAHHVPFIYTSLNLAAVPHVNVSIGFGGPIVYHDHFVHLHPGRGHYKHGLFFHYRKQFHHGSYGKGHFKGFFNHKGNYGHGNKFKPKFHKSRKRNGHFKPNGRIGAGPDKEHKGKPGKGRGK